MLKNEAYSHAASIKIRLVSHLSFKMLYVGFREFKSPFNKGVRIGLTKQVLSV